MPADPELPPSSPEEPAVETMLRDAARLRHAAFDATGSSSPATMPGHIRARLHAELAKRFDEPAAATPASPGWLARWWPAVAGAVGASLAVALFVFAGGQRPPPSSTLPAVAARKDAAPAPAPALPQEAAAAKPAPSTPTVAAAPDPTTATADAAVARANTVPAAGPEPVRTQTFTRSPLPLAAAGRGGSAANLRAAPATVNAPAPAAKASARREAVAATLSPPPAQPPLLGSFQFEQRGENVRVVDADGSVYVGQVQPPALSRQEDKAAANATNNSRARGTLGATTESAVNGPENFRFRAAGDNRTLRKQVTFEGEYTAPATVPEAPSAGQPAAPEAQIRGRVRVLDGARDQRDAEVDARSVEPK